MVTVQPASGESDAVAVATARYLRGMLDVLAALQSAPDEQAALTAILPALCAQLEWDAAALWLRVDDELRCLDVWDVGLDPALDVRTAKIGLTLRASEGLAGWCFEQAKPVSVLGRDVPGDWPRAHLLAKLASLMAFPLLGHDREVLGVIELFSGRSAPDRGEQTGLEDVLDVIGQQTGMFIERLRAEEASRRSEREREALLERMAADERLHRFLLDAAGAMAAAQSYAGALDALAAIAVPTLGDICLIDVLDEDDRVARMAARHANPELQSLVDELGRRFAPDPAGAHPSVQVIRTRRSIASDSMDEAFMRATTRDEEHFALTRRLGFSSYMSVPLLAEDEALGALTLISTDPARRIGPAELEVAEALAAQVSEVVANARRYEREHELAHTLQASLLPPSLPEIAGYSLAVRYVPGSRGAEVGGDWYDVVQLASGTTAVTVGDVSGHDAGAASAMGQVRSACRALAGHADGPLELLEALHGAWDRLGINRIATLVVAELDQSTGGLRIASAGHPPPLLVAGDVAELVEVRPGSPLGAPVVLGSEWKGELRWGAILMLYTDGLVELRPRPLDEGLRHLCAVAAEQRSDGRRVTADDLTSRVLADLGSDRSDDIALLALQRGGASRLAGAANRLALAPELDAPRLARRWVQSLLSGFDDAQREVATLLLAELVTNAVLHARSQIEVAVVVVAGGRLRVEVADLSPLLPSPKGYDAQANTGRGIPLLDALAADWGSSPAPGGKVVWFEVALPGAEGGGGMSAGTASSSGAKWLRLGEPGDRRSTSGAPLVPVVLRRLPVDLLRAAGEWADALIREFRLIAGREVGGSMRRSVPTRLVEVIAELEQSQPPLSTGQDEAVAAAIERGDVYVDLTYELPPEIAGTARVLQVLFDDADAYCQGAHLLTLEEPPAVRAFRTWVLDEISAQVDGGEPVAWPDSEQCRSLELGGGSAE